MKGAAEDMQQIRSGRARPSGQTSGTDQRPPHELKESVTALDLLEEAGKLRREPAWQQGDRNAKTFVKADDLRLVLTTLKQGATVKIMFIHVPAAWLAMMGYALIAISSFGYLVFRHPLADVSAKAAAPMAVDTTIWSGEASSSPRCSRRNRPTSSSMPTSNRSSTTPTSASSWICSRSAT